MLSQDILPIIAIFIGSMVAITAILSSTISKHRLQVERIRADAMVRAEEIRSRNQLELEKLMRQDRENAGGYATGEYGQTGTAGAYGQTGTAGAYGQTGTAGAYGQTGTAGAYGQTGTAGTAGPYPTGNPAWNDGDRNPAPRNDSAAYGDENFSTRSRVRE